MTSTNIINLAEAGNIAAEKLGDIFAAKVACPEID
jgi:hypothetical protein